MLKSIRMQKSIAVIATLVVWLFTASQALWAMGPSRLLPNGSVKVYRGDQLVSVLSEEAPLPEGALLAPEGQCGLRMDNLFMVAEDGSLFSVVTRDGGRELLIREGTIYFAVSGASGPLAFHAPNGIVTTQRMILNASAEGGLLKGYVDATHDGTRIGVLEGGTLVVLTEGGERTIATGRQITLAQADLFEEDPAAGAEDNGAEGAPGSHDYVENQVAGATVATLTVSEVDGIAGLTFSATGTNTSADGFYQIDNSGNITITEAGADSKVNDFESEPNSGSYDVDMVDSAGTTTTVAVTLNEIDLEEAVLLADDDDIPAAYFWGGGAALAAGIGLAAAGGGGGGGGGGGIPPASIAAP